MDPLDPFNRVDPFGLFGGTDLFDLPNRLDLFNLVDLLDMSIYLIDDLFDRIDSSNRSIQSTLSVNLFDRTVLF